MPKEGGIELRELAEKTGVQKALLEWLMRFVVSTVFVSAAEGGSGGYKHTHLPIAFATDPSLPADFLGMAYDDILLPLTCLPEYLAAKRPLQGLIEPGVDSATHNLISWRAGQEGKRAFEIIGQDAEGLKRFQRVMGSVGHMKPYTGVYKFGKLASEKEGRVVFVDIGGETGGQIVELLKAYPDIKPEQCLLQDLEDAVAVARASPEMPEGVVMQVHDFYNPQPVKRAKAYHLRAIAHDLSGANLIAVLKEIVAVMAADSVVLLAGQIVRETGGVGMTALMDNFMLTMGGKERREQGFRDVLGQAGLEVSGIWRAGGGRTFGVVEARLKA